MQISVKNVTWDLRLKRAYIDGPQCPGGESMADSAWSSDQEKKTYTDGRINDPTGKGYFFSFFDPSWPFLQLITNVPMGSSARFYTINFG